MRVGQKLAALVYLVFSGECGGCGNEDPYLKTYHHVDDTVGLHSQMGVRWYTFNDDGSIDIELGEDYIANAKYEIEDWNEDDYETLHYDSFKDLLKSDDGWFYDMSINLTVKDLIDDICMEIE